MNLTNLDLDTLRTLTTAHDLGGFAEAANRLGRTPAAISLQMKRLQDESWHAAVSKEWAPFELDRSRRDDAELRSPHPRLK